MITPNPLPDVLRWQLTRDFAVALDRDNEAIAEVAGKRVIVPHPVTAMEAFRQVSSARRGQHQPGDETIIAGSTRSSRSSGRSRRWRKEGEPTTDGEPFDAASDDAVDDRDAIIGEARDLLGIVNPYPEDPDPLRRRPGRDAAPVPVERPLPAERRVVPLVPRVRVRQDGRRGRPALPVQLPRQHDRAAPRRGRPVSGRKPAERRELVAGARRLLAEGCDTPAEVAAKLAEAGCKGEREDCYSCPIAKWLLVKLPGPRLDGDVDAYDATAQWESAETAQRPGRSSPCTTST